MSTINYKLISIIVPIYNASQFLERCLSSIVKQTYKHYEVIMIDDGSTDNSADIATKFKSKFNNFYLYSNKHQGVSATRNFGVQKANGYYLVFIDADDFVHKDYLKILIENAGNENNLTVCNFLIKNKNDKEFSLFIKNFEESKHIYTKYSLWKNWYSPKHNITKGFTITVLWNKIFLTKIAKTIPFILENGEDDIFLIKYIDKIETITLIKPALYYYEKTSPVSLTNRLSIEEQYRHTLKMQLYRYNFFKKQKYPAIVIYKSGQQIAYIYFSYRNHFQVPKNKEIKKVIFCCFKKNFYKKEAIMAILYYYSRKLYYLKHKNETIK